jgi:hypothetical protein
MNREEITALVNQLLDARLPKKQDEASSNG